MDLERDALRSCQFPCRVHRSDCGAVQAIGYNLLDGSRFLPRYGHVVRTFQSDTVAGPAAALPREEMAVCAGRARGGPADDGTESTLRRRADPMSEPPSARAIVERGMAQTRSREWGGGRARQRADAAPSRALAVLAGRVAAHGIASGQVRPSRISGQQEARERMKLARLDDHRRAQCAGP